MHELALAHQIIEIVLQEARRHELRRVEIIRLRVGRLRAVVEEMLRAGLEVVSQETPAAGARVEIEPVPGRARCPDCRAEYDVDDLLFSCPRCGRVSGEILTGQELQVLDFEGD